LHFGFAHQHAHWKDSVFHKDDKHFERGARECPVRHDYLCCTTGALPEHGGITNMVAIEIAILAGLGLLNLAAIGFLAHWIRMHLDQGLQDIDEKLAIAITALIDKLMSGNLGDFEPPNPIQGAIASLIQGIAQQKMQTIDATITERSPDGQFVPAQSFE
jgi:hypothetical protein